MTGDRERQRRLLEEPVGATLIRLSVPMMIGIAALLFFNIVDAFWVGQLGPAELAAMGFTFPVAMVVTNLTIGLSIGATAAVARALGEGHEERVKQLATDSLILALLIVVGVSVSGLLTIDPLFRALGADDATLPLIRRYMEPWYWGVGFLVVPMLANGVIRATGDTKTPALVMVAAGLVNAVVDPLLIFGWGPVPAFGLAGAAYATVGSWVVSMIFAIYLLQWRERMITWQRPTLGRLLESWRSTLRVGLPAAGTNLLTPLAAGAVTRIVSSHGQNAVAAYGVGTRIEGLSMIGIFAMTASITPFVAQNLGARHGERIKEALRFVAKASLLWGIAVAGLLFVVAEPIARVFNDDTEVIAMTRLYLRVVPVSYAPYGLAILVASLFNALGMPIKATVLAALRLVALAIPLAWLGSYLYDLTGLFLGIVAANVIMGAVAGVYAREEIWALAGELAGPRDDHL